MSTETQAVQPDPSDGSLLSTDAAPQVTARRIPYKSVLAALVIGAITIAAQGLLVVGEEVAPANETPVPLAANPIDPEAMPNQVASMEIDRSMTSIDQRLSSLTDQIDRGFETLQANRAEARHALSALAERLQTMRVAIADLGTSNQNLAQRLIETTTRFDTLAKNVQALTVSKRKPKAEIQPASATQPPFQIDAIDQWDDQTYVVVSQTGRVAFLKEGEQQSGWTLTHIDLLTGQVEFTGPAGMTYTVSVAR